eukprot:gnl/TRDRNA2_/TRDRNA2_184477_c0_seq1.p1 gnl/TRDRNA2_/TRDRNA2_184477_c0~~gnl/TRDRNA2_/TRDRNA2_184477_c0_seq1.p1  ORF type:complete len:236 (-),score=35.08 gnl/TRDRNA2_/TRDRNA2_184477_c0_seq1:232-939(-)
MHMRDNVLRRWHSLVSCLLVFTIASLAADERKDRVAVRPSAGDDTASFLRVAVKAQADPAARAVETISAALAAAKAGDPDAMQLKEKEDEIARLKAKIDLLTSEKGSTWHGRDSVLRTWRSDGRSGDGEVLKPRGPDEGGPEDIQVFLKPCQHCSWSTKSVDLTWQGDKYTSSSSPVQLAYRFFEVRDTAEWLLKLPVHDAEGERDGLYSKDIPEVRKGVDIALDDVGVYLKISW